MYIFKRALSAESRKTAFRLRYEVYCNEKKWLDSNRYPDLQEHDEEDNRSEIFLAYDAETGQAIGTTRLIINAADLSPLPIAKHPSVNGEVATGKCVEISRFAILETARTGNVFIGLIRMLFQQILTHHKDFNYIFFSVEERLLHKVNLLGFEFTQFAPSALWYCDQLVPSRQIISEMDDCLSRYNPEFHRWLWQDPSTMHVRENLIPFLRTSKCKLSKRV